MKIAFIGQNQIPAKSSAVDRHVEEIAARMAEDRHEVFAYVANENVAKKLFVYRAVRLKHLPNFSAKFLNDFFATAHTLFRQYDVVHFQGSEAASFAWILKIFKPSVKIVTTLHGQNPKKTIGELVACNFSDKVIVTNKMTKLSLRKKYGANTTLIPNGSDDKRTDVLDTIYRFGLRSKKYILTAGKLCKESGIHNLIEVFKQLEDTAKTTNNFKLVVVGKGHVDDEYEKYLRTISFGRHNIIFFEIENEKNMQQLFSHAQMFVDPSIAGSTKNLILEAFGYGTAALVSDVKKNTAVIGENGFSFEANSVQSLHNRLAFLLSRPEEVEKMAAAAKQQFENEFGWDAISRKTIESYEFAHMESDATLYMNELARSPRE